MVLFPNAPKLFKQEIKKAKNIWQQDTKQEQQ